jgi:hypothetical protein
MSELDDRLAAALRDSARGPSDTGQVEARVASKRAHRRRAHQMRAGALSVAAIAVVVALAIGSFAIFDDGGGGHSRRQVAAGGSSGAPGVQVLPGEVALRPNLPKGGTSARVDAVALSADEGYVRGPLLANDDVVAGAAYNRDGTSFTYPPSRIIRFDRTSGGVQDRVDLQGEILQLSDGEGARWALTRDKTVIGPEDPEFRVKRIAADGSDVSNPVPPPNQPVGPIFAGGGAVWVPVLDGVLRFDTATGAYEGKVALAAGGAQQRAVAQVGKAASVTDGAVLSRLDPGSNAVAPPLTNVTFPAGSQLVDVVTDSRTNRTYVLDLVDGGPQLFAFDAFASRPQLTTIPLPAGLALGDPNLTLHTANGVVWVEGAVDVDDYPVALEVDAAGTRIERTLVISASTEGFTFTSRDQTLLTAGGTLYRITL